MSLYPKSFNILSNGIIGKSSSRIIVLESLVGQFSIGMDKEQYIAVTEQ